jgi:hypothetical protein
MEFDLVVCLCTTYNTPTRLGPSFDFNRFHQNQKRDGMSALRPFRATDLFTFNNVYAKPSWTRFANTVIEAAHSHFIRWMLRALPVVPFHLAEIWMYGQKLSVPIASS